MREKKAKSERRVKKSKSERIADLERQIGRQTTMVVFLTLMLVKKGALTPEEGQLVAQAGLEADRFDATPEERLAYGQSQLHIKSKGQKG